MFRRDSLASRILSAVLTVAMVWAMLPMEAFAEAAQESASAANQPEAQPVASAASQATEGQSSGNQSAADSAASKAATIRFDANGGSGSMDDAKIADCTNFDQKLSASAFTRDGYTFAGWSTTVDGQDQKDSSGNVVTPAIAVPDQADIANWKFSWDANGDGTVDSNTETFDLSSCVKNNELTLYAQWNEKPTASETVAGLDSSQGSNGQEEASENTATNDARNTADTAQSDSTNDGQDDAAATDNKLTAVPADGNNALTQDNSNSAAGQTTFTAHWTNAADKEISYTNSDYDANNSDTWTDFSCTPSDNSLHKSTLKVYLKLAGDSKTTYKAGSVKIYVPAGFYRGLDKDDPLLVACTDGEKNGKTLSQADWMIPKSPNKTETTDFNYVEETKEVNGRQEKYFVMQNFKDLSGAAVLNVDIDYRFRPTMLDVESKTQPDGSDMGVYDNSLPVFYSINDSQKETNNVGVTVKTQVKPAKIKLYKATLDSNKGVFFSWDSNWGKKPADANNYFYVVWYVDYLRNPKSTMPYDYQMQVNTKLADGGELVGVKKYPTFDNNAYEENVRLKDRMSEDLYKDISGGQDLLKKIWIGVSNAPTTQSSWYAALLNGDERNNFDEKYAFGQSYEFLVRYPLSRIADAEKSGVDMEKDGINVGYGVTVTDSWQDGHETTENVTPSGDTSVKSLPSAGGSHILEKTHSLDQYGDWFEPGAQTFLVNGNDINLPDFIIHSDNFDDHVTWDSKSSTYNASTSFDVKDGAYYLYSSSPSYNKKYGLENIKDNNPIRLTDDDYSYTSFYVTDDEYDISYATGLGWQRKATASSDYSSYAPLDILVREKGSDDFVNFGTIVRTSNNQYEFVYSDGKSEIKNVSSANRVAFPQETVQIEVKQRESHFYESNISLHFGIKVHATERVKERIEKDALSNPSQASVVGGFASGAQVLEGESLGTNDNIGAYWHTVSYELRPVSSWAHLDVGPGIRKENSENSERTIPVCETMQMETSVYDRSFYNERYLKNYMLDSGTFYCLLPPGTYVKNDEIAVGEVGGAFAYWQWNGTPIGSMIRQVGLKSIKQVSNWQGTGRTMLIVGISIPQSDRNGRYVDGLRLNYILHDTYTNIVDRGGLVRVSSMFVNTSDDEVVCNSNAKDSSYTGAGFSDWEYFKDLAGEGWSKNYEAGTGTGNLDFGSITAYQAGFGVQVSTDQRQSYEPNGEVYLCDRYTDRLQYTAEEGVRTDDLVLYDVFSPDDKNSVGSFENIDVSSIEAKPTYDPNNPKTTDTCKPVVYYATQVPTDKTRSLDSGIWSTTPPKDLSTVRAVAIDCRKTDAGNDFVLDKKGTLVAYVGLIASGDKSYAGRTEKNEALISARTFVGTAPASSDTTTTLTAERTVKLLAANLSIEKTCDPASGTKDRPAEIGNDANKQLTYTIKVANNAKVSDSLPDVTRIRVKDALPAGLALDTSRDITVSSTSLGIKDGTKISGQSVVSYQNGDDGVSFDIGKLPSEGSVSITVPVVRKDPVEQTTAYTNTAVIESIGNASAEEGNSSGNNSSTTYHVTTVTRMPVAGGGGFAGLVVAGAALLVLSAYGWIRNKRRVS